MDSKDEKYQSSLPEAIQVIVEGARALIILENIVLPSFKVRWHNHTEKVTVLIVSPVGRAGTFFPNLKQLKSNDQSQIPKMPG